MINVITLPLKTEVFQEHILDKRFEICRQIYNSMVNVVNKQVNKLEHDMAFKESNIRLIELYKLKEDSGADKKSIEREIKAIYKQRNPLFKEYMLTKYDMYKLISPIYKVYNDHIQSLIAQDISDNRVWRAVEKYLFGDGERLHYKKYGSVNSIAATSHSQIVFKDDYIHFNGLRLKIDYRNELERQLLNDNKIKLVKIIRKYSNGKYRYYVQITNDGVPISYLKKGNALGVGQVGLDIGTQTLAVSSDTDVKLIELADRIQNIENEKRRTNRRLDRSRRATNPKKFNEDGTINRGNRDKWIKSNKYKKISLELKDLQRKQADIRKLQHFELVNYITGLGSTFYVEKMNFKGLQSRAKKTEKNEKGKFKRKKRFGKSLANKAPSAFVTMLKSRVEGLGGKVHEVDTVKLKASQYNHIDDDYQKKKLSQRWTVVGDKRIQRDLYSAYLLQHVNNDLKSFDKDSISMNFENFISMHDKEVQRLKGNKNLSSMGIK